MTETEMPEVLARDTLLGPSQQNGPTTSVNHAFSLSLCMLHVLNSICLVQVEHGNKAKGWSCDKNKKGTYASGIAKSEAPNQPVIKLRHAPGSITIQYLL